MAVGRPTRKAAPIGPGIWFWIAYLAACHSQKAPILITVSCFKLSTICLPNLAETFFVDAGPEQSWPVPYRLSQRNASKAALSGELRCCCPGS